jgi:hypothetical protein
LHSHLQLVDDFGQQLRVKGTVLGKPVPLNVEIILRAQLDLGRGHPLFLKNGERPFGQRL